MENKYGKGRKRRRKTAKTAAALLAGLVIAVIFMYGIRHITDDRFYVPSLWAIKSDSPGVEWIREGERVVQVKIEGRFPYCFIIPEVTEDIVRDSQGNTVSETRIYTFSAEFSLNRKGTYKIDIDSAEDVNFKYVLKFEDKDVVIENGKVVE